MKIEKYHAATAVAVALLPQLVTSDWQFRSRPDLSPPKLNITVPSQVGSETGLLFVAPYRGLDQGHESLVQPAAYIFRDDGELVWSGLTYFAGGTFNFGVDTWKGQQILRAFVGQPSETRGRSYGHHVILDNEYKVIHVVHGHAHELTSGHEFNVINGKTALIEVGLTMPTSLEPWGGEQGQEWIISTGFQEIDIETGDVLFHWESFNHVDPKYGLVPLSSNQGRTSSDAWDYFHLNSVDKDDQGNYILSARHTASIYKIDGITGDIIWVLGGLNSSFHMEAEATFAYQHHVRVISHSRNHEIEVLSLFDNSAATPEHRIRPSSRGLVLQLNHTAKTAKALHIYPAPDELSATSQGSFQILPNANAFVNWGDAGAITEYSKDGGVLFHAYLDSSGGLPQNYRAFRSNWTGTPIEEPAVVALKRDDIDFIDIYTSWNGDTETATWRFFAEPLNGQGRGKRRLWIGETRRTMFETFLRVDASRVPEGSGISAEALDRRGKRLRLSIPVRVTQYHSRPPTFEHVVALEEYLIQEL